MPAFPDVPTSEIDQKLEELHWMHRQQVGRMDVYVRDGDRIMLVAEPMCPYEHAADVLLHAGMEEDDIYLFLQELVAKMIDP